MASEQESGEWPLKRLMSEVVGSGPKSAEDMTGAQATAAFERILRGEPDPTTLGAFWLANRWKKNTPTELAAYRDAMARCSVASMAPDCDPVDCGANYDGKGRTALLGVAAGLVAAGAGTPVVVHSADRVPSGEGVAYKHVLDELGVETDCSPGASAAMTDEVGFGFYYQPNFNPGVHDLLDRREQMGVRTFLNTVETLANPANADVHLGSFYHLSFATKLTETVAASETASFSRVLLFQGLEGYDDVRPGSTTVAEWDGDDLDDFTIETAAYGMAMEEADLEVADVAADSARITEAVLTGERTDGFADAVALNAALRLYAAEDVADIEEGLAVARETIESGAAADALADLRAFEA
ncbi:anthranilate phosphoribosyltransferase [Halarchaeum rubridurum]|uniref:Anthranilate phosphoribosyltransferase n=1 Tax=Halarchaeum rubridurum TaxID=489911 RepID=A0A830FKP1_9EURY|nr:anthranilate phosphoribosyltransferase [Halarchaeum rubridurum]MBP1954014.1 anthranilate phosphoribosyltransferase [Halarchaeum rubridurum]GGM56681.1 anthranilate phosphoribosyltransferase [Halarchaeum rubridurum]